jgi:hypothetical protein
MILNPKYTEFDVVVYLLMLVLVAAIAPTWIFWSLAGWLGVGAYWGLWLGRFLVRLYGNDFFVPNVDGE